MGVIHVYCVIPPIEELQLAIDSQNMYSSCISSKATRNVNVTAM